MLKSMKKLAAGLFLLAMTAVPALAKVPVGVMTFKSSADLSKESVYAVNRLFVRELSQSSVFEVRSPSQLEEGARKHGLSVASLSTDEGLMKLAEVMGLKAIVTGQITEYSQEMVKDDIYDHDDDDVTWHGAMTLDARVIEPRGRITGFVVSQKSSVSGELDDWDDDDWEDRLKAERAQSVGRQAAQKVIQRTVRLLEQRLGSLDSQSVSGKDSVQGAVSQKAAFQVMGVKNGKVLINRGSKNGTRKGDLFLVYRGDSLKGGQETKRVYHGALKAVDVRSDYSRCVQIKGKTLLRKGDMIEPISSGQELKRLEVHSWGKNPGYGGRPRWKQGGYKHRVDSISGSTRLSRPPVLKVPTEEEINPNTCTDVRLVNTYDLTYGLRKKAASIYRAGRNKFDRGNYEAAFHIFRRSAIEMDGDVLNAYWTGRAAAKLGLRDEARNWFNEALSMNAKYEPARKALETLK